jgi:squalene-associated FAD-dependent desaturase
LTADVVVIGAGFAGLSAAVRLADGGLKVVVVEEAPRLGGRATAFTDRATGERVDNGQHVLFGCYRETFAFLRRVGTADLVPLPPRLSLTMAGADGGEARLTCPIWRPPWHLVAGVLRWRALPFGDRLSALKLAGVLQRVRRRGAAAVSAEVPAAMTVTDWLTSRGQSPKLCEWLWNPLAVAALNQSPAVAAAAPFVRVIGELFGPRPEDAAIGLPCVPLDDLYAKPALSVLESKGSAVVTQSSARVELDDAGRVAGVRTAATTISARAVVSSVPWHAFGRLWERGVPSQLAPIAAQAAAHASSPIVTVNLWFDGPVVRHPFIGLIGGPMQWVFDKSAIFGERAGHLSIVSSGADDLVDLDNAELTRLAHDQLRRALPATSSRALVRSVVVREPRATMSLAPGGPGRPGTVTPLPGFFLAGDWTDTGLPATIEGAVLSGHRAADALLRMGQWGNGAMRQ